jgi:Ca-activated chloride channel family protein
MTLHNPEMLALLVVVPLIWWRWLRRSQHAAMRFSSVDHLQRQGRTWRVRARHTIPLLRTLAVVLLVLCLARPQKGNEQTRISSKGIAIQLIVDRSSSMRALDFTLDGQRANRLAAVKRVVHDFVVGDGDELEGRPDDLIGMIVFAGYADSRCPLTLDHGYLRETLERTEIVQPEEGRDEDGTAIGDAIALGVEKLRDLDRRRNLRDAGKVKSKIMVLLTDGRNNRGDVSPAKAAEIAAAFGIKIYTIGAGTKGLAPMPGVDLFGRETLFPVEVSIDEDTLRTVADVTGGQYFRATDTKSLREIYAEIDKLEKSKTEEKRYMQYSELATRALSLGPVTLPPLLLVVLGLLACEAILANTLFRKIP